MQALNVCTKLPIGGLVCVTTFQKLNICNMKNKIKFRRQEKKYTEGNTLLVQGLEFYFMRIYQRKLLKLKQE